ncbi:PilZ domain-containing protein [Methylobacterium komagatae]|uniref:PilZ domain-containing protein n=1 Tax=Methylobacterium komagatae TaxID=374425 RepID=A0ABW2BHH5_9HYPH
MSMEQRRQPRLRVLLKGRIHFNNGSSSIDCLVRDMSTTGARLLLSETATLPEKFDLYIPQKERTYRAQLRWRREDGIGVTFDHGAEQQPAETAPDLTMTALLRRVGELEAENAALRTTLTQMMKVQASAV